MGLASPPPKRVTLGESGLFIELYFFGISAHALVWPLESSSSISGLPLARRLIHSSVHMILPSRNSVGIVMGRISRLGQSGSG